MAAGRARKAAERKAAALIKPADLPAGHTRDEAKRIVADANAEQIEENEAALGIEAVDQAKLDRKDNEIQRHIVRKGPMTGTIPVENAQPGFRYIRHAAVEAFHDYSARAAVRASIEKHQAWGFEVVSGSMPEDAQFKGNDMAAGSSARGIGDTILMRISEENWQKLQEYNADRLARQGAVEERLQTIGDRYGIRTEVGAGNFENKPLLKAAFGAGQSQPEIYRINRPAVMKSNFTEGDLRRGSIPGIPAAGAAR